MSKRVIVSASVSAMTLLLGCVRSAGPILAGNAYDMGRTRRPSVFFAGYGIWIGSTCCDVPET